MALVSDIEIRLRADIARLQQDLTGARRSVDTALSGISQAASAATKALGAIGVGLGVTELVKQVVDAQREFDKLNTSLVTATGSTANAAVAFKALQSFAQTTPFSVQQATEAFIKLRNLGLDPSEKALRSYGNTASSQGKSLNQFIEAVADAATSEFERLKEFGIKAKQNGDQVSLTFQGVTKTIGNNAKDIEKYLQDIGEVQFAGAMERQANTLDGAISNLSDTWQGFLRQVAQNGVGQLAMSGVLALSGALTDLGAILDVVAGKANAEGGQVKEAGMLHKTLTTAFEALAVVGVNVAYVFETIGKDIGAFAAQAAVLFSGGLKGLTDGSTVKAIQDIGRARVAEAEQERKAVDEKSVAILGAAAKNQAAQDAETANLTKNGTDRLSQFKMQISASEQQTNALNALVDVRKKLLGIDPQDLADKKKIQTALDTGAISQKDYNVLMAQLNKQMQSNSLVYKQSQKDLDAQAEAIKRNAEAQSLLNQRQQEHIQFLKNTGQASEEATIEAAAKATIDDLNNQIAAQQKLQVIAGQRLDNQKEVKSITGQIATLRIKVDSAEKKRDEDLFSLERQRYLLAVNNYGDLLEAAQKETKAQQDATLAQQDEIDALGMTGKQIAEVTAQRLREKAAQLEANAVIQEAIDLTGELASESRKQADELRKQADGTIYKEQLQAAQTYWNNVDQIAHDTFVSIGDGGADAFTRLKNSAKNIFFDWLYKLTLQKWIINIGASIDGTTAVTGVAGAAGTTTSLTSAASNIYSAVTTGFSTLSSSVADAVQAGLDKAGLANYFDSASPSVDLATGVTGNGSLATSIGSYASAGAGILGGYAIGSAISGSYGSNYTTAIGTAIGTAVAGPIGSLVGGALGGLANRLFGMSAKEYSDTSTLTGTLGNSAFSGQLGTAYTQKGGLFRSDKSGTDYTAVDSDTVTALTTAYDALKASSESYAKALGLDADSIVNRTDQITLSLGTDADANAQAITDYFNTVGDSMATSLLPSIADFEQSGETAATTLARLATDYTAVDAILTSIGTDSQTAFGAVGAASLEARERLISLAGGLDTLVSEVQYYQDNFLTDAQKIAPIQEEVNTELAKLGLTGITTTAQFSDAVENLVSSGALATESGAEQYAALLALAPKYKEVADYLAAAASAADDAAAAAKEAADTAAAAVVSGLQSAASAAFSALQRSVDAQKTSIETSFDALMAGIEASIDAVTTKVFDLQSLSSALKSSGLTGTTINRATAQAQIQAALAIAKASGVLPSADDIKDALSALSGDTTDQFATLADYQRDQLLTANNIEQLSGLTDNQLSVAQQTLNSLNDQKTAAQANYDSQVAQLDSIISTAQEQLDAINGVDDSVIGLSAAFSSFAAAIQAALGNSTISSQTSVSTTNQVEALYETLLGRVADSAGLKFFVDNVNSGKSTLADVAAQIKSSAEYQASHPPVVTSTTQTSTMSNSSAVVSQLQALNTRMASVETHVSNTANSTGQFASQFNTASAGGNALLVESA